MMVGAPGAVVLAAGGSTRLGQPKQLVVHAGRALVARAADAVLLAGADPVVVVAGAEATAIHEALSGLPVTHAANPRWSDGIGTSIAAGVRAIIERAPAVRCILIVLIDQPLVDDTSLTRLLTAWHEADAAAPDRDANLTIAAAAYGGTVGVPAVFGRAHFDALCSLPPASGAAALLRAAGARVVRVPMPEAATDVDTPDDLNRLLAPHILQNRSSLRPER